MNFRADRAGGVAETVAREDVVFEWVLLEDLLAEIGFSKDLGTIGAVVHRWAVGVTAGLTTLVAPEISWPVPGVDPRGRAVSRGILLIATADIAAPAPWDPELLRTVSILSWGRHDEGSSPGDSAWPREEAVRFEREIVRSPRSALRRLRGLAGWRDERLRPLLAIARAMRSCGVPQTDCAAGEALIYLANAWTGWGDGLLAPSL